MSGGFQTLSAKMRFFRDRYFKIPPLTERDWAALGFKQKDSHPSPVPVPDGVLAASLSYPSRYHAITVNLGAMLGTQELYPASDYGCAIYAGIMPLDEATLEQAASEKRCLIKPEGGLHTSALLGGRRRSSSSTRRTGE